MSNIQINSSLSREDIQSILCGKLRPISVPFQLQTNEKAYYSFQTTRMVDRENAVSITVEETKQKDVIKRSLIGNLLFGGAGAIIGGLSGDAETKSATHFVDRNEVVDTGIMIFTSKRILFVGKKQVISIPYSEIISVHFPFFEMMELYYSAKTKGEAYTMHNKEPALYFKGMMRLIGVDKTKVQETDIDQFLTTDRILTPLNDDGSLNCPSCNTLITDYKKRRDLFSTTKVYICQTCGMTIFK